MAGKRIFCIVLDSFGCGELPDAAEYGDAGSHTLRAVAASPRWYAPNLCRLGLGHIEGAPANLRTEAPQGAFGRMAELSRGKDTTTGHWELAGLVSEAPFPTYPEGFPPEVLEPFCAAAGRGVLCNRPYSGTELLVDYGREHVQTGKLLVYTSADSVFQIAAHEEVVPLEELYRVCRAARELLQGPHAVARVIARPFVGQWPDYTRTANRHDYSLAPPRETMLDVLKTAGKTVWGIGKIHDIFDGRGLTEFIRTKSNADGMEKTERLLAEDFEGLCFVNLVDFDAAYGHRNDVDGYAAAIAEFDRWLGGFLAELGPGDLLLITADHGCDPLTASTDHSREYVPLLAAGVPVCAGAALGTRRSFADLAATVLDYFGLRGPIAGESFLEALKKQPSC